jgi:TatD DNase family protein
MRLFDTHAHLNDAQFKEDVNDVLLRAQKKGVEKVVVPGTNLDDSVIAVKLAYQYPDMVCASVGVHPHEADAFSEKMLRELEKLIVLEINKTVVAVGEIGLDFFRNYSTKEAQIYAFSSQIELAIKYSLPVIIHVREAFDDVFRIIEGFNGEVSGIFHCFSGGVDEAVEAVKLGFFVSFAGNITYKKSEKLRQAASNVPMDKILIETDSPYLAPVPFRGKRNEPSFLPYTLNALAQIKNVDVEDMADSTFKNGVKAFKLDRPYGEN